MLSFSFPGDRESLQGRDREPCLEATGRILVLLIKRCQQNHTIHTHHPATEQTKLPESALLIPSGISTAWLQHSSCLCSPTQLSCLHPFSTVSPGSQLCLLPFPREKHCCSGDGSGWEESPVPGRTTFQTRAESLFV